LESVDDGDVVQEIEWPVLKDFEKSGRPRTADAPPEISHVLVATRHGAPQTEADLMWLTA
jgi:hypothetical protein